MVKKGWYKAGTCWPSCLDKRQADMVPEEQPPRSSRHEAAPRKTQEHLLTDKRKDENISLPALCAVLRRSVVSDSMVPHGL